MSDGVRDTGPNILEQIQTRLGWSCLSRELSSQLPVCKTYVKFSVDVEYSVHVRFMYVLLVCVRVCGVFVYTLHTVTLRT